MLEMNYISCRNRVHRHQNIFELLDAGKTFYVSTSIQTCYVHINIWIFAKILTLLEITIWRTLKECFWSVLTVKVLLKTISFRMLSQVNEFVSLFRLTSFTFCSFYFKVGPYLCTQTNVRFATFFLVGGKLQLKKLLKVDCEAIGVTFKLSQIKYFTADFEKFAGYHFGKSLSFRYSYDRIVFLGICVQLAKRNKYNEKFVALTLKRLTM